MKMNYSRLIVSLLCVTAITPLMSQEEVPDIYVKVDYMKVDPMNEDAYIDLELNDWKAIHEERVKAGNIVRWNLYEVRYPTGANAEYTHVTTQVFDDFGKINSRWFRMAMTALGKSDAAVETLIGKTVKARTIVKSEIWRLNGSIEPLEPANFINVNYMHVARGNGRDYVNLEMDAWKPVHQKTIDAGKQLGWGLYSLQLPSGTSLPYNFATVDIYKEFSDIAGQGRRGFRQAAHPDKDSEWWGEIMKKTGETRGIFSRQLWEIIATVDSETMSAGK